MPPDSPKKPTGNTKKGKGSKPVSTVNTGLPISGPAPVSPSLSNWNTANGPTGSNPNGNVKPEFPSSGGQFTPGYPGGLPGGPSPRAGGLGSMPKADSMTAGRVFGGTGGGGGGVGARTGGGGAAGSGASAGGGAGGQPSNPYGSTPSTVGLGVAPGASQAGSSAGAAGALFGDGGPMYGSTAPAASGATAPAYNPPASVSSAPSFTGTATEPPPAPVFAEPTYVAPAQPTNTAPTNSNPQGMTLAGVQSALAYNSRGVPLPDPSTPEFRALAARYGYTSWA
jgi:hypothetical protein